ncbi:putative dual-specificity kinase TKL-Pl-4 family [Lupinus albus]|uniref:Putative dual-specificity kinase TKL-Pl-4 family n=1 Tax=Lupinus albus TaxID=3870 RepID=A0A6A4PYR5_LUPAL|nr:putative dual-specificity kinase TKL-Pl-4 family [Lupinus albus]
MQPCTYKGYPWLSFLGNLLLTKEKKHVKVADFGIAREEVCDGMTSEAGTYRYMAPELFSKSPLPKGAKKCYDRKADVYSFAMVLWSLVKNETPFKDRNDLMAAYAAANNMRPSLHEFPECLVPLVKSCWEEDPKLRPEFQEITTTLTTLLQICRSKGTIPLARIVESDEELKSNKDGQRSKAKGPTSLQSVENISNRRTIKPNGWIDVKGESMSQRKAKKTPKADFSAKTKQKWNNTKLKFLSFFKLCFRI